MLIGVGALLAALIVQATAPIQAPASPAPKPKSDLSGIWSIGETRNCETGQAWLLMADGYYAEVMLPDGAPRAMGRWRDDGAALSYTHSHPPFADRHDVHEMKQLTIEQRTPDRLAMRNYRGTARIFHRCPDESLKTVAEAEG